jgi:hypothetical protein
MGGFVKFVYYNENTGFNQEKKQKNHGCTHLNHPGRLNSIEIFSPPVLSRSEKFRG